MGTIKDESGRTQDGKLELPIARSNARLDVRHMDPFNSCLDPLAETAFVFFLRLFAKIIGPKRSQTHLQS